MKQNKKQSLELLLTAYLFVAALLLPIAFVHSFVAQIYTVSQPTLPKVDTDLENVDKYTKVFSGERYRNPILIGTDGQLTNQPQDTANNPNSPGTTTSPVPHNAFVSESVLGSSVMVNGKKYPLREYKTLGVSTDPLAGQWWESELKLPDTWDNSTGSSDTLIAIIDTAFALDHEEFTGRWHTNTGEEGATLSENPSLLNCTDQSNPLDAACNLIDDDFDGIVDNETGAVGIENPSQLNCSDQSLSLDKSCNMIDDDGNGLIDDWRGWDFINFDRSVYPGETNPSGTGTRHGTYVASAAAASGENGVGIAGVHWNATILPLQAIDDDGYGNTLSVARSIRYAVNQGADVISLSLGGAYPDSFLLETIREAMKSGVIVVAAAGNDGCDCISYPANYPEVVAVGALNQSRFPATFSSYGANLDLLAPGTNLTTASWSATNQTSLYAGGINGTSLATPLVSGAIGLLRELRPEASTTEIIALLSETTDRLTLTNTVVRSDTYGFGTADIASAIARATAPYTHENITSYQNVSHGAELLTAGYNAQDSIRIYQCDSTDATTAVYKLSKSSAHFYSASLTEYVAAKQAGYSSSLLGFFCVLQPHDITYSLRTLNLGLEFEDVLRKR